MSWGPVSMFIAADDCSWGLWQCFVNESRLGPAPLRIEWKDEADASDRDARYWPHRAVALTNNTASGCDIRSPSTSESCYRAHTIAQQHNPIRGNCWMGSLQ